MERHSVGFRSENQGPNYLNQTVAPPTGLARLRASVASLLTSQTDLVRTFATELSGMLQSNRGLIRALSTLHEHCTDPGLKRALKSVYNSLAGGGLLADSFALEPKYFNPVFVNLIRTGDSCYCLPKMVAFITRTEAALDGKKDSSLSLPEFAYVLGTIVRSGYPHFMNALQLATRCTSGILGEGLTTVYEQLKGGSTFSAAARSLDTIFDPLFISMVARSECRGGLGGELLKYAGQHGVAPAGHSSRY